VLDGTPLQECFKSPMHTSAAFKEARDSNTRAKRRAVWKGPSLQLLAHQCAPQADTKQQHQTEQSVVQSWNCKHSAVQHKTGKAQHIAAQRAPALKQNRVA
jgi:hypothetical protein